MSVIGKEDQYSGDKILIDNPCKSKIDNLYRQIKELKLENEVIFMDFIPDDDVILFSNGSDVFVYPSWFEGFGLPVLEAIACGAPIVASNVSSIPEILYDGVILVDPKNILSIAEAIEKLLKNNQYRIKIIQKGLERAKKFKWEETAIQTLEVYKKIVQDCFLKK